MINGNKEVATPHSCPTQHGKGRGVTLDGNEIRQVAEFVQRLAVAVDNGNIVAITTQHTCQVATHLSDS